MSTYNFSVQAQQTRLPGGQQAATRRDKIAKEIGGQKCGYTYTYDRRTNRVIGYGYKPNQGCPFDERAAKKIQDAWKLAGV